LLLKTTTQALQVQSDGTMTILDDIELPTMTATVAPVLSAARDLLAVGEGGRLVRVWRGKIGERELIEPLAHPARVVAAAFDAGALYLATLADDQCLRVWEVATGQPITPAIPVGKNTRLAWDSTRQMIAAWSETEVLWFDW
jgi:hypothetical protein